MPQAQPTPTGRPGRPGRPVGGNARAGRSPDPLRFEVGDPPPRTARAIADDITARIRTAKPGTPIPSRSALAALYGVSESTVYRALGLLDFVGLVYGEQGRAKFVGPRPGSHHTGAPGG